MEALGLRCGLPKQSWLSRLVQRLANWLLRLVDPHLCVKRDNWVRWGAEDIRWLEEHGALNFRTSDND